MDRFELTEL